MAVLLVFRTGRSEEYIASKKYKFAFSFLFSSFSFKLSLKGESLRLMLETCHDMVTESAPSLRACML